MLDQLDSQCCLKDSQCWLNQGDGFYVSARTLRAQWYIYRRNIKHHPPKNNLLNSRQCSKLYGFPKAAVLLLGYSVEMFLKAGLAKAYRGCRSGMFERDIKKHYGHDYFKLSQEIDFPAKVGDDKNLALLKDFVVEKSRYPLFPSSPFSSERFDQMNETSSTIWDKQKFSELLNLTKRIRDHVVKIDNDHECTGYFKRISLDTDGYVCVRSGGHLRPRITFRYSKRMVEKGENNEETIRTMLTSEGIPVFNQIWDDVVIIEDTDKNTKKKPPEGGCVAG